MQHAEAISRIVCHELDLQVRDGSPLSTARLCPASKHLATSRNMQNLKGQFSVCIWLRYKGHQQPNTRGYTTNTLRLSRKRELADGSLHICSCCVRLACFVRDVNLVPASQHKDSAIDNEAASLVTQVQEHLPTLLMHCRISMPGKSSLAHAIPLPDSRTRRLTMHV